MGWVVKSDGAVVREAQVVYSVERLRLQQPALQWHQLDGHHLL